MSRLVVVLLFPTTACSDELRSCCEGRGGGVGLESSGYVIAGIVPPPMKPVVGSRSDESQDNVGLPPEEEDHR